MVEAVLLGFFFGDKAPKTVGDGVRVPPKAAGKQ